MIRITRTVGLFLLVLTTLATGASAQFSLLHSFSGPDGSSPTGLIQTADGSFYGAAANGGDVTACNPDGCGTIFKSDPAGHFSVLHTFHAADGIFPTGLVRGTDGNFYGTTMAGGAPSGGGAGVIFRIDPAGNFKILSTFTGGFACCDGGGPTGPPFQASDGNFYGTTGAGGASRNIHHQGGFGTVYQYNPVRGVVSIIHSFAFDGDGFYPNSPLISGPGGLLYGTTSQGSGPFRDGPGTAFKIDATGNFSVVGVLAGQPLSGLTLASDGFFYATAQGTIGGYVLRMDAAGALTFVNNFDGADGWKPRSRLLQASDGFFYGTAPQGGLLDFQGGDMFRISPTGALSILHSFSTTGPEGFSPNTQLIQGLDGALYGTTGIGGPNRHGTVFRFDQSIPASIASVSVSPVTIHSGQRSTGTVKLSKPAPPGGMVVNLGAQQGQIVIPTKITIPAGATKRTFVIKTLSIFAASTVRIYAHAAGQGVRTTITVLP